MPLPFRARFAMLFAVLPTLGMATPADGDLEARITAMGRIGSASSPRWSPDGRMIAFHANPGGVPQVFWIPAEGGYPRAVSAGPDATSSLSWSPDGRLAYAVSPGGGYQARLLLTSTDGIGTIAMDDDGAANTFAGEFARDGRYHFRSNARDPASTDAWIWDPASARAQMAFRIDGFGGIADLAGDKALEWKLVNRGNIDAYLRDLRSGERILLTPHKGPASMSGRFGANASTIYLSHNLERDREEFARIDLDRKGKPSKPVTLAARKDAELDDFALSDDAGFAVLVWNVAGRNELERIDLADGRRSPLPAPPAEIVGDLDIAPDGRRVVMSVAGSIAPSDLWTLDLATQAWTRLTWSAHPGIDLAGLVKPELRTFTSHDGLELTGWLYLPRDFRKPGPVVLSFHGGPEGQERPGFRADYQALLASGIAVFAPNIRGSSGFGKRFMQMDNQAGRFAANKDIKASADFLVASGIGEGKHLGIMGGSYGGYATMVGVTEFPDTFAAAVNLFGMVNFETFFARSEPWMAAISTSEYGDPKTQAKLLRELSPIHKLDRVRTPLMVLHGANDTNVPVVEAEQIVDTLKARGIDVEYILFPDEGHGWRKEPNRVRSILGITHFFREHLLAN
ncbi:MAG: S9 family peptidase [Xanthomonadales bacterium]|nr:S9 family peptidase [Xanthomonadales bacterium]